MHVDRGSARRPHTGRPAARQVSRPGPAGCIHFSFVASPFFSHTLPQTLIFHSSKCISTTFRRWMKTCKWGIEQRAKGRLKLGHLLRTRFKEKFRLKFQMWARWAFFYRSKRLHSTLPVFTEHLPFWSSWIEKQKRKLMYSPFPIMIS